MAIPVQVLPRGSQLIHKCHFIFFINISVIVTNNLHIYCNLLCYYCTASYNILYSKKPLK